MQDGSLQASLVQLGLVGLGRMGSNMRDRLRAAGHQVVGFARSAETADVHSLDELVGALEPPRAVWVMVPAGEPTKQTIRDLAGLLEAGDVVVDGGNSRYTDDREHAGLLTGNGIGYVDCGVSGGVWGRDNGYGLMAGGTTADIERLLPIFDALRPEGPREEGFAHAGGVGAGHYAKMVHNGVEYGLMQAYGEGFELLDSAEVVTDAAAVIKAWQRGTVVRSWLLDLLVRAMDADPGLDELRGYAEDSGEGRWAVQEAVDHAVPAPVISAALFARFSSRQQESPTMRAVAALRQQFGGHEVQQSSPAAPAAVPSSGSGTQ